MAGKEILKIECAEAPAAIGPYSQAVRAGDLIFVSGQIPVDPATGDVSGEGIRQQAELVIRNTERILASCGAGLEKVVKVDVFLKDMEDFPDMNEVYGRLFKGENKPARCVVQAARLPKDVRIELSCVAFS